MKDRILYSLAVLGLAAIGGCSDLFGRGGPDITVSAAVQPRVGTDFVIRTGIGSRRVELTLDAAHGRQASTDVRGDEFGTVPVRVTLLTVGGDSVAGLSFSQQFHRGDQHWVAASIGPQRPLGTCVGTVLPMPLAVGTADTLFVMYGSIPKGALC